MNSNSSSELVQVSSAVPASVAAIVPLAHHEEFHQRTTEEQRQRIALLLQMFDAIRTSEAGVVATCHRLALEHPGTGFSAGNIKTLFYAYRATKDWRVLVPQWRGPSALPVEFVEEFRRRTEANKRSNPARAVMMQIKAEWAAGGSIPGYGTWREFYATQFPERDMPERYPLGFFPRGWSQSNLYTKQSSKAERALARRGWAAAKKYLPHVIRDTSTLRPLELIVIDDFETDILVEARDPLTGRMEITTCTGLLALDVATRRKVGFGLKPRFKSEEGRRQAITRADVQGLLYSIFSEFGLPRDHGVTILCENAAAAISDDVADMLATLLGVQVARSGMLSDKVLANGFVPKGGKPWEKGWVESTFNIIHNHAGAFAGQKGASYQLKPDDLEARLLYAENLLSTEGLDEATRAQLKTGFWKFDDAITGYSRILDFLEARTAHKMQGFDEVCDYAKPDGSGLLTLDEAQRLSRDEVLALTPVPRMESPRERWAKLTRGMAWVKPAEHALALLLLTPKRCALRNHAISFAQFGQGFTFADADAAALRLPEGTELLGYYDAAQPNRLYVTLLDGRYIGPVRRRGAVDIRDAAAMAQERGEISRIVTDLVVKKVRARAGDEEAALAAMKAENEATLARVGLLAPNPDDGTKRRHSLTAQLAHARPGATAAHAAAAGGLAAGVAEATRADAVQEARNRPAQGKHNLADLADHDTPAAEADETSPGLADLMDE
jgi:hypothetical protein